MLAAQTKVRKTGLMDGAVTGRQNADEIPSREMRSAVGAVLQQKPIQRVLELPLLLFARSLFGQLSRQLLFAPGGAGFSVQQGWHHDGRLKPGGRRLIR